MIAAVQSDTSIYAATSHGDTQVQNTACSIVPPTTNNETNLHQAPLVIISLPTQIKPFICNMCFKGFSSKNNRDKHYRDLHLLQRKECSICGKVLSNVYNLKRHVQSAHQASLDQKTGVIHGYTNDSAYQQPSPTTSEDDVKESIKKKDAEIGEVEFLDTPIPASSDSSSNSPCPSSTSSFSPIKIEDIPTQPFFEAFIPPKYRHVEDGRFDIYISDNDNLNFLNEDDDVDAILRDLEEQMPSPNISRTHLPPRKEKFHSPLRHESQSNYLALFNLVHQRSAGDKEAPMPSTEMRLTKEERRSLKIKQERLRQEKAKVYLEVTAFKSSAEGRLERAKIRRRGKAEKERIRRLCGTASRKSKRVARIKGRDSPVDSEATQSSETSPDGSTLPKPSNRKTIGGGGTRVSSDKGVASQTPSVPQSARITRQRSKTK